MKAIGRIASVVLLGCACATAFELGANYLYWTETHKVFVRQHRAANAPAPATVTVTKIQPYVGFMQSYTSEWAETHPELGINNYGFAQLNTQNIAGCCDFPMTAAANQDKYIIGVFGNSIAEALAQRMQITASFQDVLSRLPVPPGKKPVVINLAQGGYKQPQEYFLLSYLLTAGMKFDAVLYFASVDELVAAKANEHDGLADEYPTASTWGPLTNALEQGSSADLRGILSILALRGGKMLDARLNACRWASCLVVLRPLLRLDRYVADNFLSVRHDVSPDLSHFANFPPDRLLVPPANPLARALTSWRNAARLMAIVAAQSGAQFIQVLVPSPWVHPGDETPPHATDLEKKLYGDEAPLFTDAMTETTRMMNTQGYTGIDATKLVDDLPVDDPATFLDAYGHFGPAAMSRMLDLSAHALAAAAGGHGASPP